MRLHIITGASRGLGEAIAVELAESVGDQVISIARNPSKKHSLIKSYTADLSQKGFASEIFQSIKSDFDLSKFSEFSLINNAGLISPVCQVEKIDESDALNNIMVNLHAPQTMCSEFIRLFKDFPKQKTIVNISSGVAQRPKASWAIYSAAKAGLEAFTEALIKESQSSELLKTFLFDPGIMDTEMQQRIRESAPENFEELDRFKNFKSNGDLMKPETVANKAIELLLKSKTLTKSRYSIEE